jgi:Flp pilus assembly protein TadD
MSVMFVRATSFLRFSACLVLAGFALAACQPKSGGLNTDPLTTGSTTPAAATSAADGAPVPSFKRTQGLAQQWAAHPGDETIGLQYAENLGAMGQNDLQADVLKQIALAHPTDSALQARLGKQLLSSGRPGEAVSMLTRAASLPNADWKTHSALGSALDQEGQYEQARAEYQKAMALAPNELSIQNNLGMSYALQGKLPDAEKILRTAASNANADKLPRIRQNLALVVGLQGRFDEARTIAAQDLPPDQVEANLAYLQQMLAQPNTWAQLQAKG